MPFGWNTRVSTQALSLANDVGALHLLWAGALASSGSLPTQKVCYEGLIYEKVGMVSDVWPLSFSDSVPSPPSYSFVWVDSWPLVLGSTILVVSPITHFLAP